MDPVVGYLDPGSGSVILQVLLGGLAGIAVTLKLFGRRILDFFRPRGSGSRNSAPAPDSDSG